MGSQYLDCIVDLNPVKHGQLFHGRSQLRIEPPSKLLEDQAGLGSDHRLELRGRNHEAATRAYRDQGGTLHHSQCRRSGSRNERADHLPRAALRVNLRVFPPRDGSAGQQLPIASDPRRSIGVSPVADHLSCFLRKRAGSSSTRLLMSLSWNTQSATTPRRRSRRPSTAGTCQLAESLVERYELAGGSESSRSVAVRASS